MILAGKYGATSNLGSCLRVKISLWVVAPLLLLLAACEQQQPEISPEIIKFSGPTMGTSYVVTLAHPPETLSRENAQKRVDAVLATVNAQMSTYREDSELSRVNASSANTWTPISAELLTLLKRASELNSETQGSFDVTIGPVVNLWGFGPEAKTSTLPSSEAIAKQLELVGLKNIVLRDTPPAVNKRRDKVYIDLSAIAKGYGVDQVASALEKLGATDYLVEVGGELRGQGKNVEGQPWRVAVEKPIAGQRSIELVVNLSNMGMATSGDYRNFFQVDGQRYSHTIDPRTGRPVTHDLRAVTVLAPLAADADALATALLVMGTKAGFDYAKTHNIAALFISGTQGAYTEQKTESFAQAIYDNAGTQQ